MRAPNGCEPMAGKTVLITGASAGIGRATALGLAAMGAHVVVTSRDPRRLDDAAAAIRAVGGGPVDAFVADLSVQAEVRRLAVEVLQTVDRVDVLVNNVGGRRPQDGCGRRDTRHPRDR